MRSCKYDRLTKVQSNDNTRSLNLTSHRCSNSLFRFNLQERNNLASLRCQQEMTKNQVYINKKTLRTVLSH